MADKGLVLISHRTLLADSLVAALTAGGYSSVHAVTPGAIAQGISVPHDAGLILIDAPSDPEVLGSLLALVRKARPDCRVGVVADIADAGTLGIAERAGADAFITTTVSIEAFSNACRLVSMGIQVFPPATAPAKPNGPRGGPQGDDEDRPTHDDGLSERESEILGSLVEGLSNKEIARRFDITESTVKTHLKGILRKIGASNRTQAAIWAHERGLGASN